MKLSPNAPCPCGRDAKLKRCCGVYHKGRPAEPRALVRARYSAFCLGNVGFLIETTHPEAPHAQEDRAAWKAELVVYCRQVEFLGLTLHDADDVDEASEQAWVSFTVRMRQQGREITFSERSVFRRDGRRWKYVSGDVEEGVPSGNTYPDHTPTVVVDGDKTA